MYSVIQPSFFSHSFYSAFSTDHSSAVYSHFPFISSLSNLRHLATAGASDSSRSSLLQMHACVYVGMFVQSGGHFYVISFSLPPSIFSCIFSIPFPPSFGSSHTPGMLGELWELTYLVRPQPGLPIHFGAVWIEVIEQYVISNNTFFSKGCRGSHSFSATDSDFGFCCMVCEQQKQFGVSVDVVAISGSHVHIWFRGRSSPHAAARRCSELCSATARQHVSQLLLQRLRCCSCW